MVIVMAEVSDSPARRVPPEVVVDSHGRQVLATFINDEPFRQYLPCAGGCGYLIGCGDAIGEITHYSCLAAKEAPDVG